MTDTVIIIPCFNEFERLESGRLKEFADRVSDITLCFVDDGSTDRTMDVLAELNEYRPNRFDVIRLRQNQGKAEAVRQGVLHALEARPQFIGYWDADLSTPLDEILAFRELLRERRGVEMVFGSRVKLLGCRIERSELRHYLGRIFATSVSLMLKFPFSDADHDG